MLGQPRRYLSLSLVDQDQNCLPQEKFDRRDESVWPAYRRSPEERDSFFLAPQVRTSRLMAKLAGGLCGPSQLGRFSPRPRQPQLFSSSGISSSLSKKKWSASA
jgi:hypothetical protein